MYTNVHNLVKVENLLKAKGTLGNVQLWTNQTNDPTEITVKHERSHHKDEFEHLYGQS